MLSNLNYVQNPDFPNRYISPEKLFNFLQTNYSHSIIELGSSYLEKPIYKMCLGNGKIKILAWSQMHGNESNATHAMLDLLEIFKHQPELKEELFSKITLDFIFMLNPDGSERWTRRNGLDIDLNRDFLKQSSKEFPFLKDLAHKGSYDYALNLHEQRTIFSTDGIHPATLSFLAPAEDVDRTITETRKKAMAVISKIYQKLKNEIPKQIARYSDEFYPSSTGDNFTKFGIPTILFEGGHFPDDYKRTGTRKYYTVALYESLVAISKLNGATDGWEDYREIPENKESHYDLIYRNVKLNTDFKCILDIAVQYKEEIKPKADEISFTPIVVEVGDIGKKKGWKEIDCTGKTFVSDRKFPKLDEEVDFIIE
ncbi:peptidase M14 [Kaistella flava (ex Peng et al. 2021)]|uniref:Peptidase M14 n=1 Tax=Kaistella flava (ex Peng et al. 2021) TaxID=2038776 RepID=A0A7M2Y7F9_9FLAO|nr:M14 family zinc carboxypeptidase [Kaistella flava (ex Peng et al. 2021)]QOW09342.1 peptidase M14 [Kaistella flava (ex Peng et al. 2021)]